MSEESRILKKTGSGIAEPFLVKEVQDIKTMLDELPNCVSKEQLLHALKYCSERIDAIIKLAAATRMSEVKKTALSIELDAIAQREGFNPPKPCLFWVVMWDGARGSLRSFARGHSLTKEKLSAIVEDAVNQLWNQLPSQKAQDVEKRMPS